MGGPDMDRRKFLQAGTLLSVGSVGASSLSGDGKAEPLPTPPPLPFHGEKSDVEDDGTVHVASADEASANKAIQIITDLTASAEVGKTYLGTVVRLVDFGEVF